MRQMSEKETKTGRYEERNSVKIEMSIKIEKMGNERQTNMICQHCYSICLWGKKENGHTCTKACIEALLVDTTEVIMQCWKDSDHLQLTFTRRTRVMCTVWSTLHAM